MKRLTTTSIIMLVLSTTAFSQTVTLKELIANTQCINYACFTDFILPKGFSFFQKLGISYFYLSDEKYSPTSTSSPDGKDRNQASIAFYSNGNIEASFSTSVKSQYNILTAELKQLKFTDKGKKEYGTESEKAGRSVTVLYTSPLYPKIEISVKTVRMVKDESEDSPWWISYFFTAVRIK